MFSLFLRSLNGQKQPLRGVLGKRCSENMQQIYRRAIMPKCDFNKVALQLYRNHTLEWVFSCKFGQTFAGSYWKSKLFWGQFRVYHLSCCSILNIKKLSRNSIWSYHTYNLTGKSAKNSCARVCFRRWFQLQRWG